MMMTMMMFDDIDNNSYSVGGDITFPNFSKKYFSASANCICKVQEEGRGGGVQCPAFPLLEAFPIQRGGVYCCLIFIITVITLIIVIIVIIMKEEDYTGVSPEKKYIRIENQRSSLKA